MEKLRNYLLENELLDLYYSFLDAMRNPLVIKEDELIDACPEQIARMAEQEIKTLKTIFRTNKKEYEKQYTYGQIIIWELVLGAYKKLIKQKEIIEQMPIPTVSNSYVFSENEIKGLLLPYSKMQVILSELEEALGVDRYLDRICEDTFSVLYSLVAKSKIIVEEKSEKTKALFQEKWGNNNIADIIASSLIQRNNDNQVCDQFSSQNDQVLFLLIDGFGYCQYMWNSEIDTQNEHFTLKENVFRWLRDNQLIREHLLGSAFISDTGAGLAQIFLGQRSNETGIYASKFREIGDSKPFIQTKRIDSAAFSSYFSHHNSITEVIKLLGKDAEVFYCSKYSLPPSGFSKAIFSAADVKEVLPPERVFALILDRIIGGMQEGLQVVYLTGIDNSGHTMGAYSRFERMEHLKIDTLLKNFLVELAISEPKLFDGKRSIILSADHGMFESSSIMVNRNDILNHLNREGIFGVKIVENNRALLMYNEGVSSTDDIKNALQKFFARYSLLVDIEGENDSGFVKYFSLEDHLMIRPDIVVRFVGKGLFYSNINTNEHLFHFGGHGGYSVDEVFVPVLEIPLNQTLLESITSRFLNRT